MTAQSELRRTLTRFTATPPLCDLFQRPTSCPLPAPYLVSRLAQTALQRVHLTRQ